jgi:hypothetical protein
MRLKSIIPVICLSTLLVASFATAENIDPYEDGSQYSYGENIGWVNFEYKIPETIETGGAIVSDQNLTGYIWAENVGWINLDPACDYPNTGIKNDGTGLLSGLAWGENVGWINFNPKVPGDTNHYGVTIDHEGNFNGWAWGENIGWIHFRSVSPFAYYKVQTSWITSYVVDWDDLGRFVQDWLDSGGQFPGDLDGNGKVDFLDYAKLADLWMELCPPGWPLK